MVNARDDIPVCLTAIGTVQVRTESESVLVIDPQYREGLLGIAIGTRLQVLYWMHRLTTEQRRILQAHPRGDRTRPLQGVFALRSPMRPNPIGVTTIEVIRIEGSHLTVTGLDSLDGSPILDIKALPRREVQ